MYDTYRVLLLPLLLLLLCVLLYCCCCCTSYLLPFIVCRMAKIVAGSLNLIPSIVFFLSFSKTRFILHVCTYPLAVLSHLRPRFSYILGNDEHARSQGGRQPAAARRSPPFIPVCISYVGGCGYASLKNVRKRCTSCSQQLSSREISKRVISGETEHCSLFSGMCGYCSCSYREYYRGESGHLGIRMPLCNYNHTSLPFGAKGAQIESTPTWCVCMHIL